VENNAQDLLALSNEERKHAMKALATLSKYVGCYNQWKDIRERYQLKWPIGDSLQAFNDISNSEKNLSSMLHWLKDTVTTLPKSYSNILVYDALTGLRPDEACQSVRLIHNHLDNYLRKVLWKPRVFEKYIAVHSLIVCASAAILLPAVEARLHA
jgi:hypothetical protein